MTGDWLIDKSALVRLGASPDAERWAQRIDDGRVRISTITHLAPIIHEVVVGRPR